MQGWILLHKKIWFNPRFYRKPTALCVWLWLLTHTNEKGIVLCGSIQIAQELKISRSTVRDILKRFSQKNGEDDPIIAIKSTNKFSIVTILNWQKYQRPYAIKTDNHTTTTRQPLATNKEKEYKKEIPIERKEEFKSNFKQQPIKGKIGQAMKGQVSKIIKLFEDNRAGTYNNTLHTEPIAQLIQKHGFDLVYEKAEEALALPKSDFNPWFDKPIDLADHFDWLVNRPLVGEAGERQLLIDQMREGGIGLTAMNATLKQRGYAPVEE